jgi:hypothetical protein
MTAKKTSDQRGLVEGYRSGLEDKVADQLRSLSVPVCYEATKIKYTPPLKTRSYCADFILPNGIIVETKGRFVTADRQKHKCIMAEHPMLDIRFVFSNPNQRISKTSKTTYAKWCEDHGFVYAAKLVPKDWLAEPSDPRAIKAIEQATGTLFRDLMKGYAQ